MHSFDGGWNQVHWKQVWVHREAGNRRIQTENLLQTKLLMQNPQKTVTPISVLADHRPNSNILATRNAFIYNFSNRLTFDAFWLSSSRLQSPTTNPEYPGHWRPVWAQIEAGSWIRWWTGGCELQSTHIERTQRYRMEWWKWQKRRNCVHPKSCWSWWHCCYWTSCPLLPQCFSK